MINDEALWESIITKVRTITPKVKLVSVPQHKYHNKKIQFCWLTMKVRVFKLCRLGLLSFGKGLAVPSLQEARRWVTHQGSFSAISPKFQLILTLVCFLCVCQLKTLLCMGVLSNSLHVHSEVSPAEFNRNYSQGYVYRVAVKNVNSCVAIIASLSIVLHMHTQYHFCQSIHVINV